GVVDHLRSLQVVEADTRRTLESAYLSWTGFAGCVLDPYGGCVRQAIPQFRPRAGIDGSDDPPFVGRASDVWNRVGVASALSNFRARQVFQQSYHRRMIPVPPAGSFGRLHSRL